MISFLSKNKFWVFLFLIFLFLRLPSLFEPYWYGDEGIYLTLGQGVRKGLVLYQQIHDNKPPTLYYLAALGQTVFGFRLCRTFLGNRRHKNIATSRGCVFRRLDKFYRLFFQIRILYQQV